MADIVGFATSNGSTIGNRNNFNSGTTLTDLIDDTGAITVIDLSLTFHSGAGNGGGAFNNAKTYADGLYRNDQTTVVQKFQDPIDRHVRPTATRSLRGTHLCRPKTDSLSYSAAQPYNPRS
jgi:hypothetical protein